MYHYLVAYNVIKDGLPAIVELAYSHKLHLKPNEIDAETLWGYDSSMLKTCSDVKVMSVLEITKAQYESYLKGNR